MAAKPYNSEAIHRLLVKRFDPPAWAYLREVANGTGGRATRSADAVAISLWPSRGLHIHGIEIKVYRGDWLRELKQPEKSAPVQRFCDFWWVVAPNDVVHVDELPPTWGLLAPNGGRLTTAKQAPQLEPVALSRDFVAALGRRMNNSVAAANAIVRQEILAEQNDEDERTKAYEKGKLDAAPALRTVQHALESERAMVAAFEAKSGVQIRSWNAGQIGEAVAVIMHQTHNLGRDVMESHIHTLEVALRAARETQKVLRPFREQPPQQTELALDAEAANA